MWKSDDEDESLLETEENHGRRTGLQSSMDVTDGFKRSSPPVYVLPASACIASLGGILFGYDIGIISGAILLLRKEFQLSCKQQEIIVTSLLIGGVCASFIGGLFNNSMWPYVSTAQPNVVYQPNNTGFTPMQQSNQLPGYILDHFGRKLTIMLNAGVFTLGALILSFSQSYPIFIVGRFIVGFAVSLSAVGDCVYISEIAPSSKRGLLVSLNEFGITLGILLAYLINYLLFDTQNGWRYMFGISILPAVVQFLGMMFLPASPRWLIAKGRETEALKLINVLWPHLDAQNECNHLKENLSQEGSYSMMDLFGKRENMRMRMFVGGGVILFQQLTGQPTVLYYAPSLFKTLGFDNGISATLATVGLGAVKVVFTFITLCLVDKFGRKTFLIFGSVIMTIGLVLLSALTFQNLQARPHCNDLAGVHKLHTHLLTPKKYINESSVVERTNTTKSYLTITPRNKLVNQTIFSTHAPDFTTFYVNSTTSTTLSEDDDDDGDLINKEISVPVRYLCLISLMLFVIGFAVGYGPMGWLILSEIFPTGIKGRAVAFATVANWGTNIILSMTFLELLVSIGTFWTFLSYAMVGVLSIFFLSSFVPETKGKTLEMISAELNQKVFRCAPSFECCSKGDVILINQEEDGLLVNEQNDWSLNHDESIM